MIRIYKMKKDLPFLPKGRLLKFDFETAFIYAFLDGEWSQYPLREGLAGYLWLLKTEGNIYLQEEHQ